MHISGTIGFKKALERTPTLMLAPMEGVTGSIYRSLIAEIGGVDVLATEFVRITGAKQKVRPFIRHGVPLQIQLMANQAEILADCIRFLKDREVLFDDDWLDLNVGCPSKRVNSHGAGAALLLEPLKLVGIVEAMRKEHTGPLSIKTRVGYDSDEQYPEILDALADCPIDLISIHARTKCAGYTEPVNLRYLSDAVARLPYPVIGNGEVWSVSEGQEMLDRTGVDGIMCGRGAISNPYIFKDLRAFVDGEELTPSTQRVSELYLFALKLIDLYENEGVIKSKSLVGVFKEFSIWFARNPLVGKEYFATIKRSQDFTEIRELTSGYFEGASSSLLAHYS